ncbi:hypothetical protein [Lutispora sp.]|uniref:hypothetical protein n=1 Tax=Lutispora sp. TaxID=2828727 RepID=UPI002B215E54|nr:hypothetical protein [Lutispora sp.]MEA4962865.1 hypothetical protein [Lutispora sp.]
MKKLRIVLPLFLLAVLLFGLAACTGDVFAIYKQAEEKTRSIKTGKQKVCLTFSNEADMGKLGSILKNGKNRSPEAAILYETLNKFKDFRIEYTKQYDVMQDKYISDGYIRFNIYNLEGKLYKDKDSYIIEKLQTPKYVRFTSHELAEEFFKQYDFEGQNLSFNNDITAVLADIADEHITRDSMMSNGRKILSTLEGDIKVKELKITLEGERLKNLKNEFLHALSQNTLVFSELDSDKIADRRIKEMLTAVIRPLEPLSMEYTVFIDANGYIMEKNINLKSKLYYPEIDMEVTKTWNYNSQYWDLNKEQDIQPPKGIDAEGTIDVKTFLELINNISL